MTTPPDDTGGGATGGRALLRLALTGVVVLLLVAGGIIAGSRWWPQVVTVEKRVAAPIRAAGETPAPASATPAAALPDVVDAACPAIVRLLVASPPLPAPSPTPVPRGRRHRRTATAPAAAPAPRVLDGVIVSADGYLVTSAQAVAAATDVAALLDDGRRLAARVVAVDAVSGVAMLKVEADGLVPLAFADAPARLGSWVVGLSSPAATGCRVATGVVGGDGVTEGEPLRSYLRVWPAIAAEAEGAPMLDADGRIVALAAFRSAADAGSPDLLLPGGIAHRVTDELLRAGKAPPRPFGLLAGDLDTDTAARLDADRQRGAVVLMVGAGSVADRAGLRAGDIVTAAGGAPVSGASEFMRALDPAAKAVPLDVVRRDQRMTVTLRGPATSP